MILSPDEYRKFNLGYVPQPGDVLTFNSDRHAIYDRFPDGTFLRKEDSYVDLWSPITVVESLAAKRTVTDHWGKKKRVRLVGVCFLNTDQRVCWTNYSSDGKGKGKGSWLPLQRGGGGMVDVTPPPAPLPPAISQQIPILDGAANTATSDETHELDGLD